MDLKTNHMKDEKNAWVEFVRFPFVEGYIDIWMGDCAQNPNNPQRVGYSLNSFATYYRLSGTDEWLRSTCFSPFFRGNIIAYRETMTAAEIWAQNFEQRAKVYLYRPVLLVDKDPIEAGLYMATIREGFAYLDQCPEIGITLEWVEIKSEL